jgi:MFS family permease
MYVTFVLHDKEYGVPTLLLLLCASQAFALVRGPVSFVLLRLLLGLAESGALPGVWYYVSQFYPADKTTLPYSLIETGITVSQVGLSML